MDVFEKEPPLTDPLQPWENVVCKTLIWARPHKAQVNVAVVVAEQMVEALKGGRVKAAVNMPSLDPKIMEELKPYLILVEKRSALSIPNWRTDPSSRVFMWNITGKWRNYDAKPLTYELGQRNTPKGRHERVGQLRETRPLYRRKERGYVNFRNGP